jgi:xanthine/uracil permease
MIKQKFKKYWLTLLGVAIGVVGGYLYWRYVGCESGSCPITSSPYMSSLWGAVMGGLVFSMFKVENKNDE